MKNWVNECLKRFEARSQRYEADDSERDTKVPDAIRLEITHTEIERRRELTCWTTDGWYQNLTIGSWTPAQSDNPSLWLETKPKRSNAIRPGLSRYILVSSPQTAKARLRPYNRVCKEKPTFCQPGFQVANFIFDEFHDSWRAETKAVKLVSELNVWTIEGCDPDYDLCKSQGLRMVALSGTPFPISANSTQPLIGTLEKQVPILSKGDKGFDQLVNEGNNHSA
jgi:hypothetical protein